MSSWSVNLSTLLSLDRLPKRLDRASDWPGGPGFEMVFVSCKKYWYFQRNRRKFEWRTKSALISWDSSISKIKQSQTHLSCPVYWWSERCRKSPKNLNNWKNVFFKLSWIFLTQPFYHRVMCVKKIRKRWQIMQTLRSSLIRVYRNVPKFSDRQVRANSVDPDQALHCLQ